MDKINGAAQYHNAPMTGIAAGLQAMSQGRELKRVLYMPFQRVNPQNSGYRKLYRVVAKRVMVEVGSVSGMSAYERIQMGAKFQNHI